MGRKIQEKFLKGYVYEKLPPIWEEGFPITPLNFLGVYCQVPSSNTIPKYLVMFPMYVFIPLIVFSL